MSSELHREVTIFGISRYALTVQGASLSDAQCHTRARGLPLTYFYAETQIVAEAIVTFSLLNQTDQRKVLADLKKRMFTEPKKPAKG
ncbi:hypothetical protein [Lysobacter sp. cf310]|uniref:hypothetical protein n=1 Tax=Lysobacter sp. cf310 TaxID=1761790 RepID=UPI0008E74D46|nr:hypothetical protein [Lysobacter sp. cf310]SFL20296.1 hypothetical protein SAMN04487938_3647 [Lysobacter sp. cf310]